MPSFECFHLAISRFGEIVVITLDIGKTLNSIDLVNLMSSISVRFNSFLFLYSIFNEHKAPCSSFRKASCSRHCRVVGLDGLEPSTSRLSGVRSNHLSYKPFSSRSFGIGSRHLSVSFCRLVEMMGFEPMTPCLQGRCSPS